MAYKSVSLAFCALLACGSLSTSSQPIDYDAEQLELVIDGFEPLPLVVQRIKRQEVFGDVGVNPRGIGSAAGVAGTLYKNNGHQVDGYLHATKDLIPRGPTIVQGGLDYTGPTGGASAVATRINELGTHLDLRANQNLFSSNNGLTNFDVYGGWQRKYGGMFGTTDPEYYVKAELNKRF